MQLIVVFELLTVSISTCQVVANMSKLYPKDTEAPAGGVDDMTKLSYLHEPGVLQNLFTRFELNEIYVCRLSCRNMLIYVLCVLMCINKSYFFFL